MKIDKKILGWSLYDWANSAFATTVLGAFFPAFFSDYWSLGSNTDTTLYLGLTNSIASLIVAALSPILGAIADRTSAKKKFLIFFAFLGAVLTGALALVGQGMWPMAVIFFIIASIGWSGGNMFYDSLLIGVAGKDEKKCDDVSSLGYSLGYIGGALLLTINVIMFTKPELFGIKDATQAIKLSFISVGLWWAVFSIPLIIFVKEPKVTEKLTIRVAVKEGLNQLKETFKKVKSLKMVFTFLIAYFFYIDGVGTIIKMAVQYGTTLEFETSSLIVALLITQFVAFPATLLFNIMGKKIGIKNALYIAILSYCVITIAGVLMQNVTHFYILAICIGLFQGGIQSASRSYYTRIIPEDKAGEFFGFYNIFGKAAAVLGPGLMGIITGITGNARIGIGSILILFITGFILLRKVDTDEGKKLSEKL